MARCLGTSSYPFLENVVTIEEDDLIASKYSLPFVRLAAHRHPAIANGRLLPLLPTKFFGSDSARKRYKNFLAAKICAWR
jgi:hypothetical protein